MKAAVYAFDGATMFHLSVPQMVFGEVARQGLADWEAILFNDNGTDIATAEGYRLTGIRPMHEAADADLVVLASWYDDLRAPSAALEELLRASRGRGTTVVGLCLGAFPVADSGLLASRSAVTHWRSLDELASRHPTTRIDRTVLYIDHGDVLTSAGTAAAIDACLHVVRSRLGSDAANRVARSLVVAAHRAGGQAQFVDRPVPEPMAASPISEALDWAVAHLDERVTVADLARSAHMSERSFIRAFAQTTGTTPAAWLRSRRLDEARRMLEISDLPIDAVASRCGFASPVTFRQNFSSAYGTTPSGYRRGFSVRPTAR